MEKENILIIAPEGFEEHAVAENIYAGNAMSRRASYQYGTLLNGGETGSLSIGIGMGQSKGTTSYISSNTIISKTGQTMSIDGVDMAFSTDSGHGGSCGNEYLVSSEKRSLDGRKLHRNPAQSVYPERRTGARWTGLGRVPYGNAQTLRG